MKKFLRSLLAITLLLGIVSTTALAAEPRWRNVASISPSMSAYDGSYTSAIIALEGTTEIECTLTLYAAPFRFIVLSILTMQIIISFVFIISTYRYKVNINRIEFIKI